MKITTVIFDIGGVMVGLGRIRFFNQFGFAPGVSEQVMNSTVKSVHWKELDRGILTDEEVIERFVKDAPELEKEIRLQTRYIDSLDPVAERARHPGSVSVQLFHESGQG